MDYIYHLSKIMDTVTGWFSGLPDWLALIIQGLLGGIGVLLFVVPSLLIVIYIERKLIGRFQIRIGLMRTGPHGLLQPIADAIKVLTKEDIVPRDADKLVFLIAPAATFVPALLAWAVIPLAPDLRLTDLNIGLLFIISISSLSVIGAFMAGWSSSNKYALLSAMRTIAQMVSYEVPLGLSLLGVVVITGSLSLVNIVDRQTLPFILLQPVGFLIFFIASLAEINRSPMDLLEAEQEIVAGYHTEYSGFRFSIFYLAEYTHAITLCALVALIYLGGWNFFGSSLSLDIIPQYLWFMAKVYLLFGVLVWIRATLPRMRVDQLMNFAWKTLLPLSLVNLFITAVGVLLFPTNDWLIGAFGWLPILVSLLWLRMRSGLVRTGGREAAVLPEYQPSVAK